VSKIFIDFEFTRMHQYTTPISVGIVSEDGRREFYAEFTDFDKNQIDEWLEQNVLNLLLLTEKPTNYLQSDDIATKAKGSVPFVVNTVGGLNDWIKELNYPVITLASYGLAYDSILFRELFKNAGIDMPPNCNIFGFDISTLLQIYGGDPNIEGAKERYVDMGSDEKHNALYDAHVARNIYLKIINKYSVD